MQMTQLVRTLGRSDAKLIGRDRFPLFMFGFIVYIIVVLRFLLPWANDYLAENGILPNESFSLSLADFYPMIVAYMAIFTGAMMVGTIVGFMLLDEKDHNTLKAMLVTPVRFQQYALYRVGLPAVLAFVIVVAMVLGINQALVPWWQLLLIAAGASLLAPMTTLFFALMAENKVQGFAYAKFTGISGWIIMGGWFIPGPWQWLLGVFPPFWISKAYWLAFAGSSWWWPTLIVGVLLQLGLIYWLAQRFNKVVYR